LVEKIKIFSVIEKIHDHGLQHSERVINMDALPVGKTHLQCIHQDVERTLEAFWWVGITRVQQKSDLSWTVQACTQIWRLRNPSQNLVWQCYPHPPYSPGLAPSDFHLFGPLKDAVHSTKFETDDDVIHAVRTWLCKQDKAWYQQGVHTLVPYWYTVQQKSSGLVFHTSRSRSDVTYSCHDNLSRFTFLIFVHSWRSSLFHSLHSITPLIY
jgi:hypothetical protein